MIKVEIEIGFWLTILALAAAIVLNVLAMKAPHPGHCRAPARRDHLTFAASCVLVK